MTPLTPTEIFFHLVNQTGADNGTDFPAAWTLAARRYPKEYAAMQADVQSKGAAASPPIEHQNQTMNLAPNPPVFSPEIKALLGLPPHASEAECLAAWEANGRQLATRDAKAIFNALVKLRRNQTGQSQEEAAAFCRQAFQNLSNEASGIALANSDSAREVMKARDEFVSGVQTLFDQGGRAWEECWSLAKRRYAGAYQRMEQASANRASLSRAGLANSCSRPAASEKRPGQKLAAIANDYLNRGRYATFEDAYVAAREDNPELAAQIEAAQRPS